VQTLLKVGNSSVCLENVHDRHYYLHLQFIVVFKSVIIWCFERRKMKVLQGTIHQGNNLIFPIHYGVQCCSTSVVACAHGLVQQPRFWTAKDIDVCVYVSSWVIIDVIKSSYIKYPRDSYFFQLGTDIHAKSCPPNHNGFLYPHEIVESFTLPNEVQVRLKAAKEAKFVGAIHNI